VGVEDADPDGVHPAARSFVGLEHDPQHVTGRHRRGPADPRRRPAPVRAVPPDPPDVGLDLLVERGERVEKRCVGHREAPDVHIRGAGVERHAFGGPR
jgi:hypothetical protein